MTRCRKQIKDPKRSTVDNKIAVSEVSAPALYFDCNNGTLQARLSSGLIDGLSIESLWEVQLGPFCDQHFTGNQTSIPFLNKPLLSEGSCKSLLLTHPWVKLELLKRGISNIRDVKGLKLSLTGSIDHAQCDFKDSWYEQTEVIFMKPFEPCQKCPCDSRLQDCGTCW